MTQVKERETPWLVDQAEEIITQKIVADIKRGVGCGCPSHLLDAREAIDWILFPTIPTDEFKDEVISQLRKNERIIYQNQKWP